MHFLTPEIARNAIQAVLPMIEKLVELDMTGGRPHGYLLVADRGGRDDGGYLTVDDLLLGSPEDWKHEYSKIAMAKASLSARTGLSSREVQLTRPELLQFTDVIYYGSVVRGDLIVAFSGFQAYFDEAVAEAVMMLILAQIEDRQAEIRASGKAFFGS